MSNTFAAIDFETAKGHHICSVGIVTFKDGVIIDEFHALIQPPNNAYNWHNQQVHGITEEDTRFAPNFSGFFGSFRILSISLESDPHPNHPISYIDS